MNRIAVSLIGASARAVATSAWRAGWSSRSCDLFGDVDLRHRSSFAPRNGKYPFCFDEFICRGPDLPWMYTGGLENHPGLIDRLAAARPLWGNPGAVLREARDPFVLEETLREAGLAFPECRRDGPPRGERYLLKPLRGSGGSRIRFAAASSSPEAAPRGHVYQRFLPGTPCSATFVAHAGQVLPLGVTRQLVGAPWLGAAPFAWCGNVGPIHLHGRQRELLKRLGLVLVKRFGLRGLFGVDFLIADRGDLWVVEVNPRYPASLEVLELAAGRAALPLHRAAFEGAEAPTWPDPERVSAGVVGKAVLFAPKRLVVTEDLLSCAADSPFEVPAAADLPARGEEIAAGRPVITVYARAATGTECLERLKSAARSFEERLFAR